ncbi:MAG: hypothetical protein N7Q72_01590, partial [Spiroplasma sp. Tabriz.8]|nr:hypothetical protein [Spiroplasma sp. Tabriz.8]
MKFSFYSISKEYELVGEFILFMGSVRTTYIYIYIYIYIWISHFIIFNLFRINRFIWWKINQSSKRSISLLVILFLFE